MSQENQQKNYKEDIDYHHNQPESALSKFMKFFIRVTGWKKKLERDMAAVEFKQQPAPLPKSFTSDFKINESELKSRKIWQIEPKNNKSSQIILFLHGGAYVYNITLIHWGFIEVLVKETGATIIVPDYPLAPQARSQDLYAFMDSLYEDLRYEGLSENLLFFGDSAGAGLALGYAQHLRNENKTLPQQLILLSPWLDISMRNPDLQNIENQDPVLSVEGLRMAGEAYLGPLDPKNSSASPIYGDLHGLPKISVFTGTHDILHPDSARLRKIMRYANLPINYYEYPNMIHDWVLVNNLKESKQAIDQISDLIFSECN